MYTYKFPRARHFLLFLSFFFVIRPSQFVRAETGELTDKCYIRGISQGLYTYVNLGETHQ